MSTEHVQPGRGLRWIPLVLWLAVVPILLLSPEAASVGWLERLLRGLHPAVVTFLDTSADKVIHAVLFAIGAWLFHRAAWPLAAAVLAAVLYGGAMELIQHAFPPRTPEWLDAAANTLGSCGYGLWVLGSRHWRRIR